MLKAHQRTSIHVAALQQSFKTRRDRESASERVQHLL